MGPIKSLKTVSFCSPIDDIRDPFRIFTFPPSNRAPLLLPFSLSISAELEKQNSVMEFSLSGNPLKTFSRSITCLARVGNELVLRASPSQVKLKFFRQLFIPFLFSFLSESLSPNRFGYPKKTIFSTNTPNFIYQLNDHITNNGQFNRLSQLSMLLICVSCVFGAPRVLVICIYFVLSLDFFHFCVFDYTSDESCSDVWNF